MNGGVTYGSLMTHKRRQDRDHAHRSDRRWCKLGRYDFSRCFYSLPRNYGNWYNSATASHDQQTEKHHLDCARRPHWKILFAATETDGGVVISVDWRSKDTLWRRTDRENASLMVTFFKDAWLCVEIMISYHFLRGYPTLTLKNAILSSPVFSA